MRKKLEAFGFEGALLAANRFGRDGRNGDGVKVRELGGLSELSGERVRSRGHGFW